MGYPKIDFLSLNVKDMIEAGVLDAAGLAVCVAAASRLRSAKSKVAFVVLLLVGAVLVVLRLRYGYDWMQGIINCVNSAYELIDPDGGSLS